MSDQNSGATSILSVAKDGADMKSVVAQTTWVTGLAASDDFVDFVGEGSLHKVSADGLGVPESFGLGPAQGAASD